MDNTTPFKTVDLLVVGAGPAGMAAAIFAKLRGLDVMVVEKTNYIGGTASTSAGTLWIPENSQGKRNGDQDSIPAAAGYLDSLISTHTARTDSQRAAYLATGVEAIDYLEANTEVKFVPCGLHPDYHAKEGAALAGRAIVPEIFDASVLGKDFEHVRPPIREFMIFGGMMVGKMDIPRLLGRFKSVSNCFYSGGLFFKYLMHRLRFSRGARLVMGNALVARMFYSMLKLGVKPVFNTKLLDLIVENGRVLGAVVQGEGQAQHIHARKGVVLATGGFSHNLSYRQRLMPDPTPRFSLGCESNQGEGIAAAERLGARVNAQENGSGGFWTPVSITPRKDGTTGLFPHLSLDRAKPGIIAVNMRGKRFVNEADSYHDFVEAMYSQALEGENSIPAWLVADRKTVQKYGLGLIYPQTQNLKPFEKSGYIIAAQSVASLAQVMGVPADALEETLQRYNENARLGIDPDFHKGHSPLNRFNGDASVTPNPCLAPIATDDLIAVQLWPAEIACSAGLSTDENARVVNDHEEPIEGLFAIGNDMASIMADSYPGPGTTLGPAVVFAYRAINTAAAQ